MLMSSLTWKEGTSGRAAAGAAEAGPDRGIFVEFFFFFFFFFFSGGGFFIFFFFFFSSGLLFFFSFFFFFFFFFLCRAARDFSGNFSPHHSFSLGRTATARTAFFFHS